MAVKYTIGFDKIYIWEVVNQVDGHVYIRLSKESDEILHRINNDIYYDTWEEARDALLKNAKESRAFAEVSLKEAKKRVERIEFLPNLSFKD